MSLGPALGFRAASRAIPNYDCLGACPDLWKLSPGLYRADVTKPLKRLRRMGTGPRPTGLKPSVSAICLAPRRNYFGRTLPVPVPDVAERAADTACVHLGTPVCNCSGPSKGESSQHACAIPNPKGHSEVGARWAQASRALRAARKKSFFLILRECGAFPRCRRQSRGRAGDRRPISETQLLHAFRAFPRCRRQSRGRAGDRRPISETQLLHAFRAFPRCRRQSRGRAGDLRRFVRPSFFMPSGHSRRAGGRAAG